MCEPTTLAFATFALAAGTEIAKSEGAKKERKQGTQAANRAYEATIEDLNARLEEERLAAATQVDQAGVDSESARGTARASAAAAGIQGKSVDLLIKDIDRSEAVYRDSVDDNLISTEAQIGRLKDQAGVNRDNQIAALPSYNPFLGGLRIASTVAQPALSQRSRLPKGGS